jgi:cation transport ATPase
MDEHMLTGESAPVAKEPGSAVVGGTLNLANSVVIRATRVGSDTVLQSIARLVANAQLAKAPVQSFADSVSAVRFLLAIASACSFARVVVYYCGVRVACCEHHSMLHVHHSSSALVSIFARPHASLCIWYL